MVNLIAAKLLVLGASLRLAAALSVQLSSHDGGRSLVFTQDGMTVENTIHAGPSRTALSVVPVHRLLRRQVVGAGPSAGSSGPRIQWQNLSPDTVRVTIESDGPVTGASFSWGSTDQFFGVWEYPFNGSVANDDISFEVKGLIGDQVGVNYANARAPFFFTRSGFGVYVDTLKMGRFDFKRPNKANFTFDTTALTYTVMYRPTPKELLSQYMNMSSRPDIPIDSGYGPIFWSDDMTKDFHGSVKNAQENYYDIVDHLYYNKIRATGMFADRPYGTGNWSFGNFDFDPAFFPDAAGFIKNLSSFGFDFQVWVANRAFLRTQLYNDSLANGWLFPGIDGEVFLGPALNLSIPEAYAYFLKKLEVFPKMGIKGYKIDRGEENEMPDSEQNIQMDLMIKLCDESMVNHYGKGKHFTFARSAVDRSRSLVSIWNGDPQATFQGLAYSLTSGIRAGLLGFSHWGSDTGGYLRPSDNPLVPSDELWARWMHLSTWSPMYEIMVGTGHTPWYAPYSTRLVAVLRHTADLHTRLIPLFRSLLYESSRVSGIPAMRALFLEFPGDGDPVYASPGPADDEFLLGENILVAPIVSEGGTRKVYFPGGGGSSPTRWLEWYNKTAVVPGGTSRNVSVDWMESPVYVREGAILTLGDVYRGNALWIANWTSSLDIEVYPSYSVPRATARYYTGAKEDGTVGPVVDITAVADRASQTVSVSWNGPLLVDAVTVVVYGKDQVRRVSVASGSTTMNVTVSQFKTLFD